MIVLIIIQIIIKTKFLKEYLQEFVYQKNVNTQQYFWKTLYFYKTN